MKVGDLAGLPAVGPVENRACLRSDS